MESAEHRTSGETPPDLPDEELSFSMRPTKDAPETRHIQPIPEPEDHYEDAPLSERRRPTMISSSKPDDIQTESQDEHLFADVQETHDDSLERAFDEPDEEPAPRFDDEDAPRRRPAQRGGRRDDRRGGGRRDDRRGPAAVRGAVPWDVPAWAGPNR